MASSLRKMANFLGLMDDESVESIPDLENVEIQTARPIPHRLERNETPSYVRTSRAESRAAARATRNSVAAEYEVAPAPAPVASVRPIHSSDFVTSISPQVARNTAVSALDIVPLNPRLYSDAKTVGEHFRNGQTVIMNLTDMEDEERRRLVDFAAGLVFGHEGKIERITSKVFLLTPPNVSVSGDEKRAAAETHFFNQS